jgi:uncharacterized protein (DUF1778 family)
MNTISLRMNDDETKLLRDYVSVNNLNMSKFIRDLVLDKIEDDLSLDEERILKAHKKAKYEKKYDHTEVWKMLGI